MTLTLCLTYKCHDFCLVLSFLDDLHIFKDMRTDYFLMIPLQFSYQ